MRQTRVSHNEEMTLEQNFVRIQISCVLPKQGAKTLSSAKIWCNNSDISISAFAVRCSHNTNRKQLICCIHVNGFALLTFLVFSLWSCGANAQINNWRLTPIQLSYNGITAEGAYSLSHNCGVMLWRAPVTPHLFQQNSNQLFVDKCFKLIFRKFSVVCSFSFLFVFVVNNSSG